MERQTATTTLASPTAGKAGTLLTASRLPRTAIPTRVIHAWELESPTTPTLRPTAKPSPKPASTKAGMAEGGRRERRDPPMPTAAREAGRPRPITPKRGGKGGTASAGMSRVPRDVMEPTNTNAKSRPVSSASSYNSRDGVDAPPSHRKGPGRRGEQRRASPPPPAPVGTSKQTMAKTMTTPQKRSSKPNPGAAAPASSAPPNPPLQATPSSPSMRPGPRPPKTDWADFDEEDMVDLEVPCWGSPPSETPRQTRGSR